MTMFFNFHSGHAINRCWQNFDCLECDSNCQHNEKQGWIYWKAKGVVIWNIGVYFNAHRTSQCCVKWLSPNWTSIRSKTSSQRTFSLYAEPPSLVPSRPRRFRMWRHLSSLSGKFAQDNSRTGLGTRLRTPLSPQKKSGRKYVCESPSLIEQQVVTFAHASGLHCWEALVDSCWREVVLADSCSEALSREIFFCIPNQQPTCIIDWILEVFCMAMTEGPFSRLIFVHLAPLMKQIKRSRGRLLWYVDLLTFKRSRISGLSSTICRAA